MNLWIGITILLLGVSHSQGCGLRPSSSRVVNGEDALPHSWPWQISLRVNGRHICGGSLIKNDWVVTAAHCVERNPRPSGYTVVVGAHQRTGSTPVQQTYRLTKLFKHEQFSMDHLRNDIALLQLEKPIAVSDKVNTVCLPDPESRVVAGTQCYITGWGRTVGGGNAADALQQAMLPVAEHSACRNVNGKLAPVDENSMVCAGGQGKGGCQGDSGGPFVCEEDGKFVLRGAVSWGHRMCRTDHYTVFARVSSFIGWINEKMSGGGGGGGGEGGNGGGGGECADRTPLCSRISSRYCMLPQVKAKCPKKCGACGGGGGGGGGGCADGSPLCSRISSHYCMLPQIKAKCPKKCGACGGGGGGGGGDMCEDSSKYCRFLASRCSIAIVKAKCKKTCRVCQG